jgi:hypothetical protein
MKEDEKIENPSVEYEGMPNSYDDDSLMRQPGSFTSQYNAVWRQVSARDRARIAFIILAAMFVMLLLNVVNIIKIFEDL